MKTFDYRTVPIRSEAYRFGINGTHWLIVCACPYLCAQASVCVRPVRQCLSQRSWRKRRRRRSHWSCRRRCPWTPGGPPYPPRPRGPDAPASARWERHTHTHTHVIRHSRRGSKLSVNCFLPIKASRLNYICHCSTRPRNVIRALHRWAAVGGTRGPRALW